MACQVCWFGAQSWGACVNLPILCAAKCMNDEELGEPSSIWVSFLQDKNEDQTFHFKHFYKLETNVRARSRFSQDFGLIKVNPTQHNIINILSLMLKFL